MRELTAQHGKMLELGKRGENDATRITFDVSEWLAAFGTGGNFVLLAERDGDAAPYFVTITTAVGSVTWDVNSSDTSAAGFGKAELQYRLDDTVVKSETWRTRIVDALGEAGDAPEPYSAWVDEVLDAANSVALAEESAALSAESAEDSAASAADSAESAALSLAGMQEAIASMQEQGVDVLPVLNEEAVERIENAESLAAANAARLSAMAEYSTLADYGITDAYTKAETDDLLAPKATTEALEQLQTDTNNTLSALASEIHTTLAAKVDKVEGMGLSEESFTATEKAQLASAVAALAQIHAYTTLAEFGITDAYTKAQVDAALTGYVQKVSGKDLSTNDFTDALKAALQQAVTDIAALQAKANLVYKGDITYGAMLLIEDPAVSDVYRIGADDAQGRAKAGDKYMWTGTAWEPIGGGGDAILQDSEILSVSSIAALFADDEEEGSDDSGG